MRTLVWFREDLRLHDNPALHWAAEQGSILPVYILQQGMGSASRWWLHHSLEALQSSLECDLVLRQGDPLSIITELVKESEVDALVWNRVYSPSGMKLGESVKAHFEGSDVQLKSFNGQLLIEPSQYLNQQGEAYKVFTPFWRYCKSRLEPSEPLPVPELSCTRHACESDQLKDWNLLPTKPNWAKGFAPVWTPGEQGAQARLNEFIESGISKYKDGSDIPSERNTSMLSPHLTFGEISPTQIWWSVKSAQESGEVDKDNADKFLSEIGWREFSRYLLVHFPFIVDKPYIEKFADFPWDDNEELLAAWQQGQTGYPIVDAGMRELWHTGFMHNRVRMIVASFLTKHCLTHWQHGMDWFWDTLLDADIGNNTASWQWAAGCGADAAPYFRIFNPILQGEKYDKEGDYIRKWVPELAEVPKKFLNKPWEADAATLEKAGVKLGEDYPQPIVDHKAARQRALDAYAAIKG